MIYLIKDNIEYSLDDGSIAYFLGDQGWGMMPLHRLSEHGPQQDGDTDRGYRAEARIGKLLFEIVAPTRFDLFAKREYLQTLFSPKASLKLKWYLERQSQMGLFETWSRQFDVVFADDMDFPTTQKQGFAQRVSVSLKASDPTCYDPNRQLVEFNGGGGSGMVVPIHLGDASGLFFGASSLDQIQTVNNNGNADDYPEITIVGPAEDPVITSLSYGEKIDFNGTHIAAGVTYVLDTRYGYKTVIELPNTNRFDKLTDDSDLASFKLRPGGNDIRAVAAGITSATKIQVRYYHRYTGV